MNDEDWSLCVGIGSYRADSGLSSLPGALNDARIIHEWMIDEKGGGVPNEPGKAQAELILSPAAQTEDGDPTPTEGQIEKFLKRLNRVAARNNQDLKGFKAGRRLWLYFSGHGIGFAEQRSDVGLLTADASPPPMGEFYHVAGTVWAEFFRVAAIFDEVILFMDCCREEVRRISVREPALQWRRDGPGGKFAAAFAVESSLSAFEVEIDGTPRGKFTVELEKLLKNPPKRPIFAREFLDQLELAFPELDQEPPKGLSADFHLIPEPPAAAAPEPASLLVLHGETTEHLAQPLAELLRKPERPTRFQWAETIGNDPEVFRSVSQLVITRDLAAAEVENLVHLIQPENTVLFGRANPGIAPSPALHFLEMPDDVEERLEEQADKLDAILSGREFGSRSLVAIEPVARIRVWKENGTPVASGFGTLELKDVAPGNFLVRTALGPHHRDSTCEVLAGRHTPFRLPGLPLMLPRKSRLWDWGLVESNPERERSIFRAGIRHSELNFSAPNSPGWRPEFFSERGRSSSDFSFRLVPDNHPKGAPHPSDTLRESLRLALTETGWDARKVKLEEVESDPICALLAAALRLKCGQPHEEFAQAAAERLGAENVDVQLLRGAARISEPPMLSFLWHFRLRRNELTVIKDSTADQIVGRLQFTEPWLTWSDESKATKEGWLKQVAHTAWPGWDGGPEIDLAARSLGELAANLGAPTESIERRNRKAPPVAQLKSHEQIAFLGASNDQLPAALAVAFVARNRRKWRRLDVCALVDERLSQVRSDDRTGAGLIAARDRAERQLLDLLKLVAEEWSLLRYEAFEPFGRWHFASFWDWEGPGGYVHISPYTPPENVRTSKAENLRWEGAEPPENYRIAVRAFAELEPSEILEKSDDS